MQLLLAKQSVLQVFLGLDLDPLLDLHGLTNPGLWLDPEVSEALLGFLKGFVALADSLILGKDLLRWIPEQVRVISLQRLVEFLVLFVGVVNLVEVQRLVVPAAVGWLDRAALAAQELLLGGLLQGYGLDLGVSLGASSHRLELRDRPYAA